MHRSPALILIIGLAVMVVGGHTALACACGLCAALGGNAFSVPHPKAIEIAVATRSAIDAGRLQEKPLIPASLWDGEGHGVIALERVPPTALVKTWATKWRPPEPGERPLVVQFLFIDTEHCCGVSARSQALLYDEKPPAHCDARVVTTRATLHALMTGTLDVAEAQRLGLLRLEGDQRAARFLAADRK